MAPNLFKCLVPECQYRRGEKSHQFPLDDKLRRKWLNFCRISEEDPVLQSKRGTRGVCGRHFREEDYRPGERLLGRERKYWKLSRNAFPTLHGPDPTDNQPEEEVQEDDEDEDNIMDLEDNDEDPDTTEGMMLHKCRLCMSCIPLYDDEAVDLFSVSPGRDSIATRLQSLLQVDLGFAYQDSSKVCALCVASVDHMDRFRQTILASNDEWLAEQAYNAMEGPPDFEEELFAEDARKKDPGYVTWDRFKKGFDRAEITNARNFTVDLQLVCHVCCKGFTLVKRLWNHVQSQHQTTPQIKCCGETMPMNAATTISHLANHGMHDTNKCLECKERFPSVEEKKLHIDTVHGGYKCHFCDKVFKRKYLMKHYYRHQKYR